MRDNKTINFYKNNAKELLTKYDNAQVKSLNKLFKKHISKDDKVLDLGFGSGRDLRMIQAISPNVFGLDACEEFVNHANKATLKGRVAKSILPNIAIDKIKPSTNKFDVAISIAVLMHLSISDIGKTIQNIKELLSDKGIVIVSYSLKRKNLDERYFEDMEKEMMGKLFSQCSFIMIEEIENQDVMSREIVWVTQVFKLIGQ
jgi:cyclopropane fatty-acyl-phospholipid synthase-like methyltransferase